MRRSKSAETHQLYSCFRTRIVRQAIEARVTYPVDLRNEDQEEDVADVGDNGVGDNRGNRQTEFQRSHWRVLRV